MTSNYAISLQKRLNGKISIESKIRKITDKNLQLIYTPGVATICKEIPVHPESKFDLIGKRNNIAIITDGTRILGLGNIGPDAALPVMEGKSVLYRHYGKVSAFLICLNTTNKKKTIETVIAIEPIFGAINPDIKKKTRVPTSKRKNNKNSKIVLFACKTL